jgi:hypothetical protein
MSAIDQYKHKCLGVVECPFEFDDKCAQAFHHVGIYRLDQDIPAHEKDFDGKCGDLLIGGGSGESDALRISIPEAILLYTHDDWDKFNVWDEIYKCFWGPTEAYLFGSGYLKQGWEPTQMMEVWLLKHVISFLKIHHSEHYEQFYGAEELECDGSICKLPLGIEVDF